MSRSLTVVAQSREIVKQALRRHPCPSQRAFAAELGLATSTVNRFFTGKPVDYSIFLQLCEALNLDWQTVAGLTPSPPQKDHPPLQQKW